MGAQNSCDRIRWSVLAAFSWVTMSSVGMCACNAGFISIPAARYLDSNPSQQLTTIVFTNVPNNPKKSRAFRGQEQNDLSDEQPDMQTSLFPIELPIRIQIDEVIPDCGNSRVDVDPVDVTDAETFEWQTQGTDITPLTQGPCEVWIDNALRFQREDCSKVFPGAIKMDYSSCQGDCVLRLYWLFVSESLSHGDALKHCVPIRFGANFSGSSSQLQSSSQSKSGSGITSRDSSQFGSSSSSSAWAENDNYEQLQALQTLSNIQDAVFRIRHRFYSKAYDLDFANALDSMRKQQRTDHVRSRLWHHYSSLTQTKSETRTCSFTGTAFICSSTEKIVVNQYIDE